MDETKIPVASPRKSFQEVKKNQIIIPEIKIDEQEDVVTEVAREILAENAELAKENMKKDKNDIIAETHENGTDVEQVQESTGMNPDDEENGSMKDVDFNVQEEIVQIETTNEAHDEAVNEESKMPEVVEDVINEVTSESSKAVDESVPTTQTYEEEKFFDNWKDQETLLRDEKRRQEQQSQGKLDPGNPPEQEEEALTISDSLAKNHFPELMNQAQEVYEVEDKKGQVVEQWYTVDPAEKSVSNVEALEKIEAEVDNEEDKADIKKLLAWAKSSKKKKTATMVIREKKKLDMYKAAVDYEAVPIIIEDSNKYDKDGSSRFQVKPTTQETFRVRRKSVIEPVSETVVTRSWLENAIRVFEDEDPIVLINMRFDRNKEGAYEAHIKAEVGPNKATKSYDWIIKEAPKKMVRF